MLYICTTKIHVNVHVLNTLARTFYAYLNTYINDTYIHMYIDICIFCDAIEKTSKAKQLCCFRFLSSASFRFSVSWFCFCYNHNFSSRIAFDGQLTRPARSTRLALSLSVTAARCRRCCQCRTDANAAQFKVRLS